jgi:hypothetical protein
MGAGVRFGAQNESVRAQTKAAQEEAKMIHRTILTCWLLLAAGTAQAQDFDTFWHDGKAELDGYRLVVSRYGQNRHATAVMVFVTEPFSESKRVKVDDPKAHPSDTFDALKLNLVRDFQTGIYDYNTMVSVFVRSSTFEPVKVSFASMEWCGNVYEEMIFGAGEIHGSYASYFENESGTIALGRPDGGITEDELFIRVRGLRKDFLGAGESRTLPFLPGSFYSRLSHQKQEWTQATLTRAKRPQAVTVPAGRFNTTLYDIRTGDGRAGQFWIEAAYPHRIVKWSLPPDIDGQLTGSQRLEYWKLHGEGDEKYLKGLGLVPPPGH